MGSLGAITADSFEQIVHADAKTVRTADASECAACVLDFVYPEDVILIKGSRALQLEHVVAALTGEESAPHG